MVAECGCVVANMTGGPYHDLGQRLLSRCRKHKAESRAFKTKKRPVGTAGVYLLALNGKIVYVGESVCCERRIWQHHDKAFDSYWFCATNHRKLVEALLIGKFKPHYNKEPLPDPRRKSQHLPARELSGMEADAYLAQSCAGAS